MCTGQRLREAKKNAKHGSESGETRRGVGMAQEEENSRAVQDCVAARWLTDASTVDMMPLMPDSGTESSSSSTSPSQRFEDFVPADFADIQFPAALTNPVPLLQDSSPITPEYPLSCFGALYINGMYLKIPCSTVVPARSDPVGPEVPVSLRPTELQLITIHPRWIDRFPFPKMRDSLISLSGVIDDEDFMKDLALLPSFDILPGGAPWDPKAWKMKKPFADKWGYLFF